MSLAHSLTHSAQVLVRFTEKLHIWPQKYICVHHQKKFLLAFAKLRFYMFSLRYRILSLNIDSLPSNLHTKRIHSDGKSVYSRTDRLIEGPFRDTLPSCKELTIVRDNFLYACITHIYSQLCELETTIEAEGGLYDIDKQRHKVG